MVCRVGDYGGISGTYKSILASEELTWLVFLWHLPVWAQGVMGTRSTQFPGRFARGMGETAPQLLVRDERLHDRAKLSK